MCGGEQSHSPLGGALRPTGWCCSRNQVQMVPICADLLSGEEEPLQEVGPEWSSCEHPLFRDIMSHTNMVKA